MTGYNSVDIHNCNTDLRSINIWIFDHEAGIGWQEMGSLPPQFDDAAFCPAQNSKPLSIALDDGHIYDIVCIDTGLNECPSNDPTNVHCIRLTLQGITGKDDGPKLPITVS